MNLLQIVPGYGKQENALFDYALILKEELLKYDVVSFFDMERINEADAIFLNYSNYGFQKKGIPIKLHRTLATIVREKKIPLYTFFHEVYASGENIFMSSYWLHPVQKYLYKQFYNLSEKAFCGNETIEAIIKTETKDKGKKLLNVGLYANVPVLSSWISCNERNRTAVVFGTYGRRHAVYFHADKINQLCKQLNIQSIIDIGDGDISELIKNIQVPVLVKGRLSVQKISQQLQSSLFGFINYSSQILGKSGIFAAYAGNAMIIVNFYDGDKKPCEGLKSKVHYYQSDDIENIPDKEELEIIQYNIFNWYQPRGVENHVSKIAEFLNDSKQK